MSPRLTKIVPVPAPVVISPTVQKPTTTSSNDAGASNEPTTCVGVRFGPATGAQRMQMCRAKKAAREKRIYSPRVATAPVSHAERQRSYKRRKLTDLNQHNFVDRQNLQRDPIMTSYWLAAKEYFNTTFYGNSFGHSCNVCDRLWFKDDLNQLKDCHTSILLPEFGDTCRSFQICANCKSFLDRGKMPTMSSTNGFKYPPKPAHLPRLNDISTRLISPRIPFMQIRRLRRDGGYGIVGQVINVPIDVEQTVTSLPRQLDDDYCFNVSLKRHIIHKSSYLSGFVKKGVLRQWLEFLVDSNLYRHLGIEVDWAKLDQYDDSVASGHGELIEPLDSSSGESENLLSRQHTLLWSEDKVFEIAPGQGKIPLNITMDSFAEELSFPQIYFGHPRHIKLGVRSTPFTLATSEIRRTDRRGVVPEHILYMAAKIMRYRVVDGIRTSFRCVKGTENITREMLENKQLMDQLIEKNFAYLKSLPNSAQFWSSKKNDLFAMLRQLGKPTVFLTMSANETRWPDLLKLLHRLSGDDGQTELHDPLTQMDRSKRAHLVNEDPVACCIYFDKLKDTIMTMLQSKRGHNPFGKYRVIDYFLRIEFQHRGSPHAHVVLWLDNDPKEKVSEDMPKTVQLINDLCSVSKDDLPPDMYDNQVHRHTFTCTKRGEDHCRFNIPYWPMRETRILLPLAKDDGRLEEFKRKSSKVKDALERKVYGTIDEFLEDNMLNEPYYLNLIRSTLKKPSVIFKRDMSQIMVNTFNPCIGSILNSNMDLQFILDEFSCAAYVVDYINKANRGAGQLHRELLKISETHPEMTQEKLMKELGSKILSSVEMSAQEAAWYLLRKSMSHGSREVLYIPTVWPVERHKSYKTSGQLDRENVALHSTDVWTKSIIQKYEERPRKLRQLCLADFAAWYTSASESSIADVGSPDCEENDESSQQQEPAATKRLNCRRRTFARVIRYRNYDPKNTNDFKREMVTLFLPFDNELVDILDRNRFLDLYKHNIDIITAKQQEYESGCDIEALIKEARELIEERDDGTNSEVVEQRVEFIRSIIEPGGSENFDDLSPDSTNCAVRKRTNVMSKEDYCAAVRHTNVRQRELIHEMIHRLVSTSGEPLQIFFTGPAGCGKTYTLKLLMETINRFSQCQNHLRNAYIACATTGKAAINFDGTTVDSVFHLTRAQQPGSLSRQILHTYRQLFTDVNCIILDEVSMLGGVKLHEIERKLREISGEYDQLFGGMHMIFCGDLRQLAPVAQSCVYKATRDNLAGGFLWQSLCYFPLTQVMRQSDVKFSTILTKIGDGEPFDQQATELIESRFRTEQWCDANLSGVIRLFYSNHECNAYNNRFMVGGIEHAALDTFTNYSKDDQRAAAQRAVHKMKLVDTGGCMFLLRLAPGYPYMITSNIDVEDGLVNGAIGTLRFIQQLPTKDGKSNTCLWLEFSRSQTGSKARIKFGSSIAGDDQINPMWTPILPKSVSIKLPGNITCKRVQFPLQPASAITIHKSQGGTFEKAVIYYDKSQATQLVYVALSRVTCIEGLFLVNIKNDHTFYHRYGSNAPSVRDVKNEYLRMSRHPLSTLTDKVKAFINHDSSSTIIICTINAQSLIAHQRDIVTDSTLTCSDYLIITETWMRDSDHIVIDGYSVVSQKNRHSNIAGNQRTAGGVAIYRKISRETYGDRFGIPIYLETVDVRTGEFSLVELTINGTAFFLAAVYIHPNAPHSDIKNFLSSALVKFKASSSHSDSPLMLTGDFNVNVIDSVWLVNYMKELVNLSYIESPGPTTIANTTIDLTFVRGMQASCMPYISYFSHHRPLFNKICLDCCP